MLFIIKMSNYNIISRQNYGLVKGAQIMPRKGENIYKRKDGRWEGRFRKYRDANGKIKYGYVYARSYTEVKIKLNKIKQEITIPAESGTADIIVRTFSEVVKEWITYKTPLLKESSVAKYTNIINLHLLPFFHEQTMQSISVQRLEEFYKKLLLKVTPKGTLLAPKTTLDILSVMKSIVNKFQNLAVIPFRQRHSFFTKNQFLIWYAQTFSFEIFHRKTDIKGNHIVAHGSTAFP